MPLSQPNDPFQKEQNCMSKIKLKYDTGKPGRLRHVLVFLSVLALLITTAQLPLLLGNVQASSPSTGGPTASGLVTPTTSGTSGTNDKEAVGGKPRVLPKPTNTVAAPAMHRKPAPAQPVANCSAGVSVTAD